MSTEAMPASAPTPPDTSAMGIEQLFQHVWNTEYVPRWNEAFKREQEQRADAFAEVTLTVCGEELRMMTPRDLYILEALENKFVTSGVPTEEDCAQFIWLLHSQNDRTKSLRNSFRKGRVQSRAMRRQEIEFTVAEIMGYMDKMMLAEDTTDILLDETQKAAKAQAPKPSDSHFIADYLINVAAEIGHIDPYTGKLLGDTPLPRLTQYARSLARRRRTKDEEEATLFDSLRVRCMGDVNAIMAERRAKAASLVV